MSTGYTRSLEKGEDVSFEDFVLGCATVFFHDTGKLPEKITPSTYHAKGLQKASRRLEEIESWDDEEAERQAAKSFRRQHKEYVQSVIETNEVHNRYYVMLQRVKAWKPPTPKHERLKKFMIAQLEESIRFDCTNYPIVPPVKLSGADYKAQQIKHAVRDIDYHTRHHDEEAENAEKGTVWIRALRENLTGLSTAEA